MFITNIIAFKHLIKFGKAYLTDTWYLRAILEAARTWEWAWSTDRSKGVGELVSGLSETLGETFWNFLHF